MTLNEETRRDIVEAKEAVERAVVRMNSGTPGSAHIHLRHAIVALERVLGRARDEETGPPPENYNDPEPR